MTLADIKCMVSFSDHFGLYKLMQKEHHHRVHLDLKSDLLAGKDWSLQEPACSSWSYLTFLNTHKMFESTPKDFQVRLQNILC